MIVLLVFVQKLSYYYYYCKEMHGGLGTQASCELAPWPIQAIQSMCIVIFCCFLTIDPLVFAPMQPTLARAFVMDATAFVGYQMTLRWLD
jgi:hypothetical protein